MTKADLKKTKNARIRLDRAKKNLASVYGKDVQNHILRLSRRINADPVSFGKDPQGTMKKYATLLQDLTRGNPAEQKKAQETIKNLPSKARKPTAKDRAEIKKSFRKLGKEMGSMNTSNVWETLNAKTLGKASSTSLLQMLGGEDSGLELEKADA